MTRRVGGMDEWKGRFLLVPNQTKFLGLLPIHLAHLLSPPPLLSSHFHSIHTLVLLSSSSIPPYPLSSHFLGGSLSNIVGHIHFGSAMIYTSLVPPDSRTSFNLYRETGPTQLTNVNSLEGRCLLKLKTIESAECHPGSAITNR